mgnify:FL=1
MMRLIPVLLFVVLLFPGCFAKRVVAPLFQPESVEFPKDPATGTKPAPSDGKQPAGKVLFQDAKIYPDVHTLERDVLARFKNKDDVERLAEVAQVGTLYVKMDCSFIYNLDQQQLLALPRGFAPREDVAAVAPQDPSTTEEPDRQALTAKSAWAGIEMLLRNGAPESAMALDVFITKFPDDPNVGKARVRLVMAHLQAGDMAKAKAALAMSDLSDDSAEAVMVRGLLTQMEQATAEGKTVKGTKFFLPEAASEKKEPESGRETPAPDAEKPVQEDAPVVPEPGENCEGEKKPAEAAAPTVVPTPTKPEAPKAEPAKPAKAVLPTDLMLEECNRQHPAFFRTGVFYEEVFREPFLKKFMRSGQPGFMLPGNYTLNQSTMMRPNLVLVGGYRLASLPDPNVTGGILNHCRLVSLHVVDLSTKNVVFERELKAPAK